MFLIQKTYSGVTETIDFSRTTHGFTHDVRLQGMKAGYVKHAELAFDTNEFLTGPEVYRALTEENIEQKAELVIAMDYQREEMEKMPHLQNNVWSSFELLLIGPSWV